MRCPDSTSFSKLAKIYCPNRSLVVSFHPLWSIACLACEYFCKCLMLRFLWEKSDSQPNLYFYDLDYITMCLMVGFQNLNFEINHWISSFSKHHCLWRDKGFIPLTPLRGLSFHPLSHSLPSSHRLTLLEFILISTGRSRRNEISRRSRCLDFPLIVSDFDLLPLTVAGFSMLCFFSCLANSKNLLVVSSIIQLYNCVLYCTFKGH